MIARYQSIRNMRRGFALVLICLLGFTAAYSWHSWHAEKEAQIEQLSLLADLESKSIDSFFGHFESSLGLLSQDLMSEGVAIESKRVQLLLKRFKQANSDIANIVVVRPDGQLVASAMHTHGSRLPNNANEASFVLGRDTLLKGPDFDIGRPIVGKLVNEWVIPLRYAMRDAKGQLVYIIAATLPLSRQQSFWQSMYLPQDVILGLLRDDGYLLSRYPNPPVSKLGEAYGKPRTGALMTFLKENRFPQMGVVEGANTVGVLSVMAFHRLSWIQLTFMVSAPVSNIRAAWWKNNQAFYVLTFIFLLSGTGIYLWLMRRQNLWEEEREVANDKLIEAIRAKDQAEKELLALELDDVKLALDHHSIVSIADVSGNITYANDKFCEVSGYSSAELLGQNHRILNSGLHSKKFFIEMWHTISSGEIWHGQVRNKAKDGTFYWVDSTIVPFLNKEGKPYQYVSVRTDISAFIKARAAAEDANKAKSQFLSSMSHELRTPLNAILGFGQLLDMLIDPDKLEQHEYVHHMLTAGNQLLGLINDLLDLSRIEIGKLDFNIQNVSIADLAISSANLVASSLANSKNITIENTITEPGLIVKGDALRIRQVLINLLTNAVKYNRDNGKVTLGSEMQVDGRLRVQVRDTGEGIASDKLSLLFNHFERIDQKHGTIEGAGIGLYVCKQLVEAMHGEIGVESVKGEGSTFWFVLPPADEAGISDDGRIKESADEII
jgi:PAS domain S-box-containing protein